MIKEEPLESSPKSEEFPKIQDDLFDEDDDKVLDPAEPDMCAYEADDYTPEELDKYLTASVMILQGGESIQAKLSDEQNLLMVTPLESVVPI